MIFGFYIPEEETYRPRVVKHHIITEAEYYSTDREKLKNTFCPACSEHNLFKGFNYIGCTGCMRYFSENEVLTGILEEQ